MANRICLGQSGFYSAACKPLQPAIGTFARKCGRGLEGRFLSAFAAGPLAGHHLLPLKKTFGKAGTDMQKTYVLDTNVLIQAPYALMSFEDNQIV